MTLAGLFEEARSLRCSSFALVVWMFDLPRLEVSGVFRAPLCESEPSARKAASTAVALWKCVGRVEGMALRAMRLVARMMTLLIEPIVVVVCRRPEKQMVRTNTTRVIAVMTNEHARRNRAVRQFPRYAMSANIPFAIGPASDDAITEAVRGRSPQPAAIRPFNLAPETTSSGAIWPRVPALARTKTARRIKPRLEVNATPFAYSSDRSPSHDSHSSHYSKTLWMCAA